MTRTLALLCLALFLFVQPAAPAAAETITGHVVGVHDGDTLTLLDQSKHQIKIRLAEIDAPELGQPYGSRAKQELSGLAFDKAASVQVEGLDRYGRTIGRITINGIDVNAELVKRGAAWVYRKYSKDVSLIAIEQQAREAKAGLWALPPADRIPPSEWRTMSRSVTRSGQSRAKR